VDTAERASWRGHCLTGCAIGEVLGMNIGTSAGLRNADVHRRRDQEVHRRRGGQEAALVARVVPLPAVDVRQSIARIGANPFVPLTESIRGFVFDLATGKLNDVA
jgi:hypothetical protein